MPPCRHHQAQHIPHRMPLKLLVISLCYYSLWFFCCCSFMVFVVAVLWFLLLLILQLGKCMEACVCVFFSVCLSVIQASFPRYKLLSNNTQALFGNHSLSSHPQSVSASTCFPMQFLLNSFRFVYSHAQSDLLHSAFVCFSGRNMQQDIKV